MGRAGGIRPISPFLRTALCLGHEVKVEVISAIPDTGDSQRVVSVRRFFFQLQEVNRLDRIDFSHRVRLLGRRLSLRSRIRDGRQRQAVNLVSGC